MALIAPRQQHHHETTIVSREEKHQNEQRVSLNLDLESDTEWDKFQAYRQSADYYMEQYLDCLDAILVDDDEKSDLLELSPGKFRGDKYKHGLKSNELYWIELSVSRQDKNTSQQWRLKILQDSIIRDLKGMDRILATMGTGSECRERGFPTVTFIW